MTTNYPGALDNTTILKNNAIDATVTAGVHAPQHNNVADAILAIETELGVNPSGTFSTVVARLASAPTLTPSANQIFQGTADVTPIIVKQSSNLDIANLLEAQSASGSILAYITRTGAINAAALSIAGVALAAANLSDEALLARLASPAFTGVPTAPTPSNGDSSTKIATTAFVQSNGTPPASVVAYAGSSAPTGWLLCDGTAVSRATYATLFALIGTTYGVGDGSTTFNVPDLRGRTVVGKGTNADVLTLNLNEGLAVGSRTFKHYHGVGTLVVATAGAHGHAHTLAISGGSHSHTGSGSTDGVGDHAHSYGGIPTGVGLAFGYSFAGSATAWTNGSINGGGGGTGGAGAHSHGVGISINASSHTHPSGEFSGSIGGADGTHTHGVSGNIGSTSGVSEAGAYIVLNYLIKI
jgi:microcystin-dependent protein